MTLACTTGRIATSSARTTRTVRAARTTERTTRSFAKDPPRTAAAFSGRRRPFDVSVEARSPVGLLVAPTSLAQEALDIGDELITSREARLIGEELQALDVGASVLVVRCRGIEQVAPLERPGRELPDRRLNAKVAADRRQERDRRRRIRRVHVVRDLREEPHRRDSVRRRRQLEDGERRGWHPQQTVRAL